MKKSWYILILTVLISCNSNKVEYFATNSEKVFQNAKSNDKMIFIDFSAVWCGGCQFFDNNFIPDSLFKSYMNENFNTLKIDAGLESNKAIVTKYEVTGLPTFIITDSEGQEIDRIVGLQEKTPEVFIDAIKNLLIGKEQLDQLINNYVEKPDSIDLFLKVIYKYLDKDLYQNIQEFATTTENKSQNDELIRIAKYWHAYASIRNTKIYSPIEMTAFVNEQGDPLKYIEYGLVELFYHYRKVGDSDSVQFYSNKLIGLDSQNHFKYVRDYAGYLYENNINIELADKLATEYSTEEGFDADHWTPFLTAHSLAKKGKLDEGIEIFDHWMTKYSKPENFKEDYWNYRFYIDLILFYKVPSDYALEYAKKFEENNPSIYNKKNLAHIYYLNGKKTQAIDKLEEVKTMIEDPSKKKEIDELINKYSKEN